MSLEIPSVKSHRAFAGLLSLGLAISAPSIAEAQNPKAHTHGRAELNIVIEGKEGMLDFSVPAADVYGFERKPKNDQERKKQEDALNTMKTRFSQMVIFDPSLGCTIAAKDVHIHGEDDDHDHDHDDSKKDSHAHNHDKKGDSHDHDHGDDGHAEVHGEFSVTCKQSPAGKDIRFGFSKVFPTIRSVQVQLLSDDRQDGRRIDNDRGTVRP